MKTTYIIACLMCCCALLSCDHEDVPPTQSPTPGKTNPVPVATPDNVNPIVKINAPAPDAMLIVIESVMINLTVTDDKALKEILYYITDANNAGNQIKFGQTIFSESPRNNTYITSIVMDRSVVVLPPEVASSSYKVTVLAKDTADNIGKDSVLFTIYAPELDKAKFVSIVNKRSLYVAFEWYGIKFSNDPVTNLYRVMFTLLDKDWNQEISKAEWQRFVDDFRVENKDWTSWDKDKNDSLNDSEFNAAMEALMLYEEWNSDSDASISESELAAGFFYRWDHDKNGVLSRNEYEERYFYYYRLE